MDEQKKPQQPKRLTEEEFEADQKMQRENYETLKQYKDFDIIKQKIPFNFMTYDEYVELYDSYYNITEFSDDEKKNIVMNSIE